jgi:hypothetical protein
MVGIELTLRRARKRKRAPSCPRCKACEGVRELVYGEPDLDTQQQSAHDEIVLGGCCITGNDPKWDCRQCGHRWPGVPHDPPPRFTVQVRGQDGCMRIGEWTVRGQYRRLEHALAELRASHEFKHSAYELRVLGPKGGVRWHRAQRPVGPHPGLGGRGI